ncbi:hypothetical protein Bca52824_026884 [Brassica carinata]|uniref:Uncharacterized protein n=1 Tax=Brassica carinata TaxID=52824 RepID=A0A8X7SII4_BRACI|nr:hypothetical protein Bca52824_026884 [Brassica carinata]
MICFPDSNLQPVEEVQLNAVELLKLYEEKLNEVQKMSLFVQDLMEKGECTVELFQSFKKSMGNFHRMHEKLRRVISNGLQQRRSLGHKKHNQLEQANNEFMRINQKNSRLLNAPRKGSKCNLDYGSRSIGIESGPSPDDRDQNMKPFKALDSTEESAELRAPKRCTSIPQGDMTENQPPLLSKWSRLVFTLMLPGT